MMIIYWELLDALGSYLYTLYTAHNSLVRQAFLFKIFRDKETDSKGEVKQLVHNYQQGKDMHSVCTVQGQFL